MRLNCVYLALLAVGGSVATGEDPNAPLNCAVGGGDGGEDAADGVAALHEDLGFDIGTN